MGHGQLWPGFAFKVVARDEATWARAGVLYTPHGPVETPVFMPVGTKGSVKAVSPRDLEELGAQIILANTYHLYLRPGHQVVEALGGLHRFMGWDRAILTDSGGFQVFSLGIGRERRRRILGRNAEEGREGSLVAIDEDGVTFTSYIDGSTHTFTPERAVEVQEALGADIIMAFDECAPSDDDYAYARAAAQRTLRWALRCRQRWMELELAKEGRPPQALFGIVQGGNFMDLRRESTSAIVDLDLPGIAFGGESIGYNKEMTRAILEWIHDLLPEGKPRYAMGVGEPDDFFAVVERGIDMFDCVLPTRLARNGSLLTPEGRMNVTNARFRTDPAPPVEGCGCYTCRRFSRAYLRHLFKSQELLAYHLATIHNLYFAVNLAREIRRSIVNGRFKAFRDEFLARWQSRAGGEDD